MNPQKKVQSILNNIEDGKASEDNIASLTELLDNEPSIAPEVIERLNNILKKGDVKAFSSSILALNKIIENNLGLEDYSIDVIVYCMQKRKEDLREDSITWILEILLRITQRYPERLSIAVPELIMCLKNSSLKVRVKAYFLLALLAITHHEFFTGRSKDLVQVLNGLYLNERINACRLIKKIAEKDKTIVADTYEVLEDLRLNHSDSNLRSEAAFALEMLIETAGKKASENNVGSVKPVQKSVGGSLVTDEAELSDKYFSEFSDLVTPDEEDLKNALEAMGLKHLVVKRDTVENGDAPKSQELIHAPGSVTVLQNDILEIAKTKSDFFTIASHDLRTPLNSVIGFSELLKQGAAGGLNEKQEHYVNNVLSSGKDLVCLISDILDLAGKIDLVTDKVPVQATIDEIFNLIKEKAAKNKIVLKKELDTSLDFIEVDKQRFEQILFNLLINAIKFSKTNGATITITAKREGDMARFSVTDTGIGIKEEDLGKLFKEFVQLDAGVSRKYGGSGLGLAISKKLVELHGGKIRVESKYGEGSTFTFLLPVVLARILR